MSIKLEAPRIQERHSGDRGAFVALARNGMANYFEVFAVPNAALDADKHPAINSFLQTLIDYSPVHSMHHGNVQSYKTADVGVAWARCEETSFLQELIDCGPTVVGICAGGLDDSVTVMRHLARADYKRVNWYNGIDESTAEAIKLIANDTPFEMAIRVIDRYLIGSNE